MTYDEELKEFYKNNGHLISFLGPKFLQDYLQYLREKYENG